MTVLTSSCDKLHKIAILGVQWAKIWFLVRFQLFGTNSLKKYSKIVAVATTTYKTAGLLKVPYW